MEGDHYGLKRGKHPLVDHLSSVDGSDQVMHLSIYTISRENTEKRDYCETT